MRALFLAKEINTPTDNTDRLHIDWGRRGEKYNLTIGIGGDYQSLQDGINALTKLKEKVAFLQVIQDQHEDIGGELLKQSLLDIDDVILLDQLKVWIKSFVTEIQQKTKDDHCSEFLDELLGEADEQDDIFAMWGSGILKEIKTKDECEKTLEELSDKIEDGVLSNLKHQYLKFFFERVKEKHSNNEYSNLLQESPLNTEADIWTKLLQPLAELVGIQQALVHNRKSSADTHIQIADDTLYFLTKLEFIGTDKEDVILGLSSDSSAGEKHHFRINNTYVGFSQNNKTRQYFLVTSDNTLMRLLEKSDIKNIAPRIESGVCLDEESPSIQKVGQRLEEISRPNTKTKPWFNRLKSLYHRRKAYFIAAGFMLLGLIVSSFILYANHVSYFKPLDALPAIWVPGIMSVSIIAVIAIAAICFVKMRQCFKVGALPQGRWVNLLEMSNKLVKVSGGSDNQPVPSSRVTAVVPPAMRQSEAPHEQLARIYEDLGRQGKSASAEFQKLTAVNQLLIQSSIVARLRESEIKNLQQELKKEQGEHVLTDEMRQLIADQESYLLARKCLLDQVADDFTQDKVVQGGRSCS